MHLSCICCKIIHHLYFVVQRNFRKRNDSLIVLPTIFVILPQVYAFIAKSICESTIYGDICRRGTHFVEQKNDNKFYSDNVIDFWIEDLCESKHAIKYFLFFNVNNSFKINELYYRLECEKQLHFIFTNQNNGHNNPWVKEKKLFGFDDIFQQ